MSPPKRLSRKEKGKAVVDEPACLDETTGEPLEDFRLVHRDALEDTAGLDTPQRLLVRQAEESFRVDDDGNESSDDSISGQSPVRRPGSIPIKFHHANVVDELSPLPGDLLRSNEAPGPGLEDVQATWSTSGSVKKLLTECGANGVTFLIPSCEQRPWSPPIGYECVYESFFQRDTKLWFPIPRLVTSYALRRKVAINQFVNGAWRMAVALMVMAAEVGVSMSVRAFEELSFVKPMGKGIYSVKLRPNFNVITGHPSKTKNWQRYYFYVKSDQYAFEEPPNNTSQSYWGDTLGRLEHCCAQVVLRGF